MSIRLVTVREAIERGLKETGRPAKTIIVTSIAVCILLLAFNLSWWALLLIPAGLLSAFIYSTRATTRWRIRAYEQVADIHQLQRSAELSGLLMRQSHDRIGAFVSERQRNTLIALLQRFSGDHIFIDDPSIPHETPVYRTGLLARQQQPLLVISEAGIEVCAEGLYKWEQVINERIAQITYHRMSARTGADVPAGADNFFRFENPLGRFEIPLSSISISAWELDLLLYIYRGRFDLKQ